MQNGALRECRFMSSSQPIALSLLHDVLSLVSQDGCCQYQEKNGDQNPKLALLPNLLAALCHQESEVQDKGQQHGEQDYHGAT
jgi:hypothetical protein